jgi:hypothetical protein
VDILPSHHLGKSAYIIREKKMKRRKKSKGKISKKKGKRQDNGKNTIKDKRNATECTKLAYCGSGTNIF